MDELNVNKEGERKPAPLACRIAEDIVPRDSVLSILEGMDEWYNGYEFLWRSGGWTGMESIPAQYHDTFRVAEERAEIMKALGHEGDVAHYVMSACLMQAVRWFTGYGKKDYTPERQVLYNATARALALGLGHEDKGFCEWDTFESRVITYNDTTGRSFAGIRDAITTAIYKARRDDNINVKLADVPDRRELYSDNAGE